MKKSDWGILIVIFVCAGILRARALFNDLWLDEVWSILSVQRLDSPWKVFTDFPSDNNHLLNSLYIYLVGDVFFPPAYRLLSWSTSLASVGLIFLVAKPFGIQAALLSALMFSFSYVNVLYASEARGYAPMAFFALAALLLFRRLRDEPKLCLVFLFWLCVFLGFLAHSTFLIFYLSLLIWHLGLIVEKAPEKPQISWLRLHTAPIVFVCLVYTAVLSKFQIGGGSIRSTIDVVISSLSLPFGAPELSAYDPLATLIALCAALLVTIVLGRFVLTLSKERGKLHLFYFSVIFFAPLAFIAVLNPAVLFLRYFYVSIVFSFVLLGAYLSRLWEKSLASKILALCLIVLFFLGNVIKLVPFTVFARGNYVVGLEYIEEHSANKPALVGSNHDFRTTMMFEYYLPRLHLESVIRYVKSGELSGQKPEWFIVQSDDSAYRAPEIYSPRAGLIYLRKISLPHVAPSGLSWHIYRKR